MINIKYLRNIATNWGSCVETSAVLPNVLKAMEQTDKMSSINIQPLPCNTHTHTVIHTQIVFNRPFRAVAIQGVHGSSLHWRRQDLVKLLVTHKMRNIYDFISPSQHGSIAVKNKKQGRSHRGHGGRVPRAPYHVPPTSKRQQTVCLRSWLLTSDVALYYSV